MKELLAALALLLCANVLSAEEFNAKVIAVMDGDTIMVLRDSAKIKIRLANIDAPEVGHAGMGDKSPNSQKDQAFGLASRESLLEMVRKKQVRINSQAVDQYGRTVATVLLDGHNVNEEQVRRGMAWEYTHYHGDRGYIALQSEAQQARRGLWSQSSPVAPWQWRKTHSAVKPDALRGSRQASRVIYDASCGRKKHCKQMESCDEAYFYLVRCGVRSLDGNKDGVPCKNLCEARN